MNLKEYFIVMKHSGLSWLGHLLPFGVVVALNMNFTTHSVKFNEEYCQAQRFGNSGLFLVFSKEVQNKLYENRKKEDQWRREEEELNEKKELKRLNKKYGEELIE